MGSLKSKLISSILVALCCLQAVAQAQQLQTFSVRYDTFNSSHYEGILEILGPAMINNDALQLTPDTASDSFAYMLNDLSTRVLLKQPFRLWNGDNFTTVASFNTSFLFNVYPILNGTPGDGFTFAIVPRKELPPQSSGQYLGLNSNKFIAIEVDTKKQAFDPDANHIGLDINSIISVKHVSLTPLGIEIASKGAKFFNLWVQYDGVNKVIQVYIAEQAELGDHTPPRPSSPILESDLDLREHLNEYSYFGFSASAGDGSQLNAVLRWNLTVEYFPEDRDKPSLKIILGAGVPALLLLLIGVAWLVYYFHKRRIAQSDLDIMRRLKCLPGMPQEFKFRKLKKATKNFDDKNKLGQGGFGVVYRGKFAAENLEIAVKWFSRESIKGQDDFLAELTIINRLRHKHLVRLLGWCHKNKKLLLVYEYMPNNSLDKHLFAEPGNEPLNWNLRYKIISGVASAMHYLHNEYDQMVVHRDLKASNIMLDANFNARLGDFGLARALDKEKTSYTEALGVLGTMGYIAPECFLTGKATRQSDVYAFGAVVLETICGLRPGTKIAGFQFLVDWVWLLHRDGRLLEVVDKRLGDEYVAEEAEKLLLLGLACSHPIANERPKAQDIVQIISGSKPTPNVPPFKPAFLWPAAAPIDIASSAVGSESITTSLMTSGRNLQCLNQEIYAQDIDHSMV